MENDDNIIESWRRAPNWYKKSVFHILLIFAGAAFLVAVLSGCSLFPQETTIVEVKRFPCPVKPVQSECSAFKEPEVREFCLTETIEEWNRRWSNCQAGGT